MGPEKWFFLALVVLVLFGAKRIPEIGGSLAKGIREFKRNLNDVERQIKEPEPVASVRPADVRSSDLLSTGDVDATAGAGATREESRPEPKRLI
jgi:sec-independent protein translocase protein TatA